MSDIGKQMNIQVDKANLYKEETFTDMKTGTIQRLSPITEDGAEDTGRPVIYNAQTQIMSQMGPIPVNAAIEATSLSDAWDKFPAAIEQGVEKMVEEAQKKQIEDAKKIVVPGKDQGPDAGIIQ